MPALSRALPCHCRQNLLSLYLLPGAHVPTPGCTTPAASPTAPVLFRYCDARQEKARGLKIGLRLIFVRAQNSGKPGQRGELITGDLP